MCFYWGECVQSQRFHTHTIFISFRLSFIPCCIFAFLFCACFLLSLFISSFPAFFFLCYLCPFFSYLFVVCLLLFFSLIRFCKIAKNSGPGATWDPLTAIFELLFCEFPWSKMTRLYHRVGLDLVFFVSLLSTDYILHALQHSDRDDWRQSSWTSPKFPLSIFFHLELSLAKVCTKLLVLWGLASNLWELPSTFYESWKGRKI